MADDEQHSDAQRQGVLSFDSMKMAKGIYHCTNQQRIVGFGSNFYQEPDIIASLFKSAAQGDAKEEAPMASEYLVFYFTAMDASVHTQFIAARYALSSITTQFLIDVIPRLIVALGQHQFSVAVIVADGSSHIRATEVDFTHEGIPA